MIAGGCLSGCGLIAASFCNTVQELYFCIGVIGGEWLLIHSIFIYCHYLIDNSLVVLESWSLTEY